MILYHTQPKTLLTMFRLIQRLEDLFIITYIIASWSLGVVAYEIYSFEDQYRTTRRTAKTTRPIRLAKAGGRLARRK